MTNSSVGPPARHTKSEAGNCIVAPTKGSLKYNIDFCVMAETIVVLVNCLGVDGLQIACPATNRDLTFV